MRNGKRKTTRRTRKTYRKTNRRTSSNVYKVAKKAVRSMAERKVKEYAVANQALVGAFVPSFTLLNDINTGALMENRIGNKILLTSVYLTGYFYNLTNTVKTAVIMLLYDREPAQATPTIAEVFDTSILAWYQSPPRNLDNRYRFMILYQRRFIMSSTDSDDRDVNRQFKIYKRLNLTTLYDSSGAGSMALRKGALYLVWSSNGSPTVNEVGMSAQARLRYIDL